MSLASEPTFSRTRHLTARADVVLMGIATVLALAGVVVIYSATRDKLAIQGINPHYYLERQAIFVVLGVGVMVVLAMVDYRRLEHLSTVVYVGIVLALLGVLAIGTSSNGSTRWFSLGFLQIQPSEFATLALILVVSTYCARRPEGIGFRDMVRLLLLAAVPILLVIKQPDLGTGIVLTVVLLVLLAVAGLPGRYLVLLVVAGIVAVIGAVKFGLLHQYQLDRLISFIHPNRSSAALVYNVNQAKDAIGSGGMFGTGLFHGAQTNLAYVPSQQTDFIFSAIGEQLGFVGAAGILFLLGVLAWRMLRTAQLAREPFGRMLAAGCFTLVAFSVFENVGMNIGLMPVAGIPLPFFSYGGSAALTFFASVGVVAGITGRGAR
ncbi:MAG: rod shape-determining protein RodA [Actinomycetota bacterium]|nr:rod shape-determining protein RodA [Actinomycetota bacterium]